MPLYQFKDTETDEVFEEFFTYEEKKIFLQDNQNIQEIIGAPNLISGISGITHKNDSGFNDLLNRIGNANPLSPLAREHGDKGIKQTKVREAVDKARKKIQG